MNAKIVSFGDSFIFGSELENNKDGSKAWPDLITDSENAWTIKHQGNSILTKSEYFKLGQLEIYLLKQIENPTHGLDHVLYITESRPIDVSDFLGWMDLTHSAYLSCHGQFALFRPDNNYVSTLIDIGYLK